MGDATGPKGPTCGADCGPDCPECGVEPANANAAERCERVLRMPMVHWQAAYEHDREVGRGLLNASGALAVRAARLAAYVNARDLGKSHAVAVRAQNAAARKVRTLLGFTYANDDVTF